MRFSSAPSASQTAESANRPPTQRAPRLDKPGWAAICAHSPLGSLPALAQRRSARMVEAATSASQAIPSSSLFAQREKDKPRQGVNSNKPEVPRNGARLPAETFRG